MITDPVRSSISNADKMFGISTKSDTGKVRLLHPSGQFLNINGTGLTNRSDAGGCYVARPEQAVNMRKSSPFAAGCKMVGA